MSLITNTLFNINTSSLISRTFGADTRLQLQVTIADSCTSGIVSTDEFNVFFYTNSTAVFTYTTRTDIMLMNFVIMGRSRYAVLLLLPYYLYATDVFFVYNSQRRRRGLRGAIPRSGIELKGRLA